MDDVKGVYFNNKHSYRNWGLVLKGYPIFTPPQPETKLIKVPGSDVVIDLTESLTGKTHYGIRKGTFEFYVIGGRSEWPSVYSSILNELHGKRMQITMDDDPNYYYIGRVAVDEWQSDKATATIVITAEVEPYKRARHGEGRLL